jgi:hypothetical protein
MEQRFPIWRVAANILNKQSHTADKGWPSSFDFEQDADNTSPLKLPLLRKKINAPQTWVDPLLRTKQWKSDKRFGTWNVRNLYIASSLITAARELARDKLDLVDVEEVRWDKGAW